jgi:hypothetical protein
VRQQGEVVNSNAQYYVHYHYYAYAEGGKGGKTQCGRF